MARAGGPTPDLAGVSGVPLTQKSAMEVSAAIGVAIETPQRLGLHPLGHGKMLAEDDLGAGLNQSVEPELVPNSDIDLCRRAVELPEQEEDVCSICLDEFTGEDPGQATVCNHLFHLQCVMQWAQRSRECPLCFKTLQLQDIEMNSLLPFGEYTPPPGPGTSHGMFAMQQMYGVESWELEQLLQRLAIASVNQPGGQGSRRHRHRHRRSGTGHEGETESTEDSHRQDRAMERDRDRRHRQGGHSHHVGRSAVEHSSNESNASGNTTSDANEGRYARTSIQPTRTSELRSSVQARSRRSMSDATNSTSHSGISAHASPGDHTTSTFDLKAASIMLRSRFTAMSSKCRALLRGSASSNATANANGPSTSQH